MRVEDWFPEFATKLQSRCRRSDWPEAGTEDGDEYWLTLETNLRRNGVTAAVADEASSLVAAEPPRFLGDYPRAILDAVKRVRAEQSPGPAADDRQAAELASKDCRDCGGSGWAGRWVEHRGGFCAFLCLCPLGRWMKSANGGSRCPIRDLAPGLPTERPSLAHQDAPEDRVHRTDVATSRGHQRAV